jgi:hypothetical protein
MPSLKDYFDKRDESLPPPVWIYGDRIFGRIDEKIPVVGMVIREDYEDPTLVLVHLDLPVKIDGQYRFIVYVPGHTIVRLVVLE